ncbi:sigma 54-interacting transcriptional regulator [Moraxella osloensis]|nr:sigma 54-interacting transcriptional regulator [Moraxella osloensis]MBW4017260.1 sigma 54-interacting transcriptional regulator [Moraxella osloensis]
MTYTNNKTPTTEPIVWVIDDDQALRMILEDTLTDSGFQVQTFGNAQSAWRLLQDSGQDSQPKSDHSASLPSVIVTDIRMPMMNGLDFSSKIKQAFAQIPVIIMTAHADVQSAVDSYQSGAFDYLPKPFELDDAIAMVKKACMQSQSNQTQKRSKPESYNDSLIRDAQQPPAQKVAVAPEKNPTNPSGIIGQSIAMQKVFRAIGRLSHMPMTVLITGESGTGKELIASALHEHSPRKSKPFIALNMAAIPHDLIEAELFGHEKGAFTGATTTRQGRFEQAHGGTLFLDEIGDMPLPTQTRLLRVLANGEFYRVGGLKPIKVDVRIIAATHQNLETLVQQGKFREDLFYRLNVIRLALPSLRERREDIPLLIDFFMQNIAKSMHTPTKTITPSAMHILQSYPWQGNVRQLENTCRWLSVMTTGQTIQPSDLPPEILQAFESQDSTPITTLEPNTHKTHNYQPDTQFEAPASEHPSSLPAPSSCPSASSNSSAHSSELPTPLSATTVVPTLHASQTVATADWITPLQVWAQQALAEGQYDILQTAYPMFEKCLLEVALAHTAQHKGQAADLLGWGRNTVTRKYQQLIEGRPVKPS